MSEGLAQGSYVVARVGFGPATFRTQATEPTTEPPCPTNGNKSCQGTCACAREYSFNTQPKSVQLQRVKTFRFHSTTQNNCAKELTFPTNVETKLRNQLEFLRNTKNNNSHRALGKMATSHNKTTTTNRTENT